MKKKDLQEVMERKNDLNWSFKERKKERNTFLKFNIQIKKEKKKPHRKENEVGLMRTKKIYKNRWNKEWFERQTEFFERNFQNKEQKKKMIILKKRIFWKKIKESFERNKEIFKRK